MLSYRLAPMLEIIHEQGWKRSYAKSAKNIDLLAFMLQRNICHFQNPITYERIFKYRKEIKTADLGEMHSLKCNKPKLTQSVNVGR